MMMSRLKAAFSSSTFSLTGWGRLWLCVGFMLIGGLLIIFWVKLLFYLTLNYGRGRSWLKRYEQEPRTDIGGSAFSAKVYAAVVDGISSGAEDSADISLVLSNTLVAMTVWGWIYDDSHWVKSMGTYRFIAIGEKYSISSILRVLQIDLLSRSIIKSSEYGRRTVLVGSSISTEKVGMLYMPWGIYLSIAGAEFIKIQGNLFSDNSYAKADWLGSAGVRDKFPRSVSSHG